LRGPGLWRGGCFFHLGVALNSCFSKLFHHFLPLSGLLNLINNLFGIKCLIINLALSFSNFVVLSNVWSLEVCKIKIEIIFCGTKIRLSFHIRGTNVPPAVTGRVGLWSDITRLPRRRKDLSNGDVTAYGWLIATVYSLKATLTRVELLAPLGWWMLLHIIKFYVYVYLSTATVIIYSDLFLFSPLIHLAKKKKKYAVSKQKLLYKIFKIMKICPWLREFILLI